MLQWLRQYRRAALPGDISAGIVVFLGLVGICGIRLLRSLIDNFLLDLRILRIGRFRRHDSDCCSCLASGRARD